MHDHVLRSAAGFRFTLDHLHDRRIAFVVDLDAVSAGPQERQREIRRVDLDVVVLLERAHANVHDARGHAHLDGVVVDVEEREARVAVEAYGRLADIDLGARAFLGPQLVAGGQRAVDDGVPHSSSPAGCRETSPWM